MRADSDVPEYQTRKTPGRVGEHATLRGVHVDTTPPWSRTCRVVTSASHQGSVLLPTPDRARPRVVRHPRISDGEA